MWKLVPALVREMGGAYPELGRAEALIEETLKLEETRFRKTLERGLRILDDESGALGQGHVFSGDTAYSEKLANFAKGADILVHESLYEPGVDRMVARVPFAATLKEHLLASHTKTEDIGRVAAIAKPKLLVLSHLVPGDDPTITDDAHDSTPLGWAEYALMPDAVALLRNAR